MNFRVSAAAALGLCVAVSSASSAQTPAAKRPMTFADLQAMKRVGDPQISPSGKWVLFSVTDVSLEKNTKTNHLWVVPLDGSAKERQITSGAGEANGRFSPDGKWVSFTHKDQIWVAPFNDVEGTMGGDHAITSVDGGADGAIWSPDSKRLLFVASVFPECSDLGDWAKEDACDAAKQNAADESPVKAQVFTRLLYRHWNAYTGDRRSHIIVVDADGKDLRDLTPRNAVGDAETPTFSLGGPLGYAWAPDSKEIAYVTNLEVGFAKPGVGLQPGESTNNDIFTLKLDEPGAKAVKVSTAAGSDDGPQYSPDGKWLAWRTQARNGYESDKFDLVIFNRASASISNLTSKFHGWVDEFAWQKLDRMYFTSPHEGQEWIFARNLLGQDIETPRVISKEGEFSSINVVADDSQLVAVQMKVGQPSEIVSIKTTNEATIRKITELDKSFTEGLQLSPLESFWFAGANGTRVQGFIVRPPNFDPAKKYPVKFLMHGGPQGAWGDAWSYRWNPELFAANGYVVVMVNPRGSTGYGQKFLEEVSGDWGGRAFEDLMKGLDYAEVKYPFIDKSRECALGASYGGFMANWVLTHTDRFKCIVTHDGMYNPQSAFGTTEELWFNEWEFRPLAKRVGAEADPPAARKDDNKKSESNDAVVERAKPGAPSSPAASSRAKVGSQDAVVEQAMPAHPWDFYDKPASEDPFRKWCPMLAIKNAHTPTLVVHGQRDYRLDVSEGFQLFTALQLLGVPSKMLYFPDEGHWVLKPQNSQLWYETVNDWCDRWLGMNKYASVGPEMNPAAKQGTPRATVKAKAGK